MVLCVAFLSTELGVICKQEPDDDGDPDAADDDEVQGAAIHLPARAAAPIGPEPAVLAVPSSTATSPPPVAAGLAVPGTISMASSLNSFGSKASSSSSLKRFGKQYDAVLAPPPAGANPVAVSHPLPTVPELAKGAAVDAENAHIAAEAAKEAAHVANKIATHSVHITQHAQSALKDARESLHKARVNTEGLSKQQKESLKIAEAKLKEATKVAEYGRVKNAKYVKAEVENKKLQKLDRKMDKVKEKEIKIKMESDKTAKEKDIRIKMESDQSSDEELEAMRKEIEQLRKQLKDKEGDKADDDALLKELQDEIKSMEAAEKKEDRHDKASHDEMKAEVEKLRSQIKDMEDKPRHEAKIKYSLPADKKRKEVAERKHKEVVEKKHKKHREVSKKSDDDVEKYRVKMTPVSEAAEQEKEVQEGSQVSPVEQKGIDIDTAMPYGDLEPFGREDTAQELTESSIKESDGMVDQLERAEVAEEKRAVFRSLTRLRGAAITSFDGVARSQTGNIDEYNKIHKWRNNHPLHHLADEESDISKWAFPDNAD